MNQLDHVVVAAPDLEAAGRRFEEETGVAPAAGGAHPGLGTRNSLVSFGGGAYLEIIAPDPEQDVSGSFAERLATLAEPLLFHWAVRVSELAPVQARAKDAGLAPSAILPTSRSLPSGERLSWELLGVGGHDHGGLVPFYIDWLEAPHPSESAPVVGALRRFALTLDAKSPARALLDPLPDGVSLDTGSPALEVCFDSPKGEIRWTTGDALPPGFGL